MKRLICLSINDCGALKKINIDIKMEKVREIAKTGKSLKRYPSFFLLKSFPQKRQIIASS
jgi:hypothetical protein